MTTNHPAASWVVVIPVKRLAIAKTRLSRFAGPHREALALAFALDTVAAALGSALAVGVVVVTDDPEVANLVTSLGAKVVADEPANGLNPALRFGASAAKKLFPGHAIAALSSDLPALRTVDLDAALAAAAAPTSFVSDVEGVGTTLLMSVDLASFAPLFGHRSRAAHRAAGVVELELHNVTSLRRDVDTEVDLYDARRLGLGAYSTAVVEAL